MTLNINDFLNLTNLASGFGPAGSASYSLLRGLNVLKGLPPLPHNTDHQGFVFFTKPGCNLTYDNVTDHHNLNFMADFSENSMGNAIRCMLSPNLFGTNDPRDLHASSIRDTKVLPRSPLVDDRCAFLPISNFLKSLSPMPDTAMDVYNSQEGKRGEQISFMDGYSEYNGSYDVTATFDNMDGDFITAFFGAWIEYGNRVVDGTIMPFPIFLICDEIDYASRYYRIILDKSRRFVQNIAAPWYCFPKTNPDGAKFGYDRNESFIAENNEVQVVFQCVAPQKNRSILMQEFNETVYVFNVDMESRKNMTKIDQSKSPIPFDLLNVFNYQLYPHINLETYELEWWCDTSKYNEKIDKIKSIMEQYEQDFPADKDTNTTQDTAPSTVGAESLGIMVTNSVAGSLKKVSNLAQADNTVDLTPSNTTTGVPK